MILDLFGFQGRISRFGWWMTQLFCVAAAFFYGMFFGEPPPKPSVAVPSTPDDAALVIAEMVVAQFRDPVIVAMQVLSSWLFLTTSVQRLHDRGNSGWRVIFAFVPTALLAFAIYTFVTTGAVQIMVLLAGFAGILVSVVWILVEFGMLRGDDTDNDYGPPPGAESRRKAFRDELEAMGETYARSRDDEVDAYPVAAPSGQLFGRR